MPLIMALRIKYRYLIYVAVLLLSIYWTWFLISELLNRNSVSALSTVMAGRMIVIDPGHGGKDAGSRSANGTLEKDITLEVSKRLAAILGQAGAVVILTRESDMWLADPDAPHKKRSDLTKRVEIANQNNADVFISIHVNSYIASRSQRGAQTFSQPGADESGIVSRFIQNELIRVLRNTNRKPKEIDFFIRHAKVPAVIVEIGFLSNNAEEKLLLDSSYQSKVAFAIYSGLVRYFAEKDLPK